MSNSSVRIAFFDAMNEKEAKIIITDAERQMTEKMNRFLLRSREIMLYLVKGPAFRVSHRPNPESFPEDSVCRDIASEGWIRLITEVPNRVAAWPTTTVIRAGKTDRSTC